MTSEQLREIVKASREQAGLKVTLDGAVFYFASAASRDEFIARAERLGRIVANR